MKIVSLVPSQTELLYYLGLGEHIYGQTKFCIHPKQRGINAQIIGGTKNLNVAKILAIKPDLIIGNKEENEKSQIEILQQHCPVHITDVSNFEDALDMMAKLGELTQTKEKASQIIDEIKLAFKALKPKPNNLKSAVYLIWDNPKMTVGRETFINDMLQKTGFSNLMTTARYPEISEEVLQSLKPEYVLLSSEPYPFKEKHIDQFKKILTSSKVIIVDGEMFSWYGSRMLKAAKYFISLQKQIQNNTP